MINYWRGLPYAKIPIIKNLNNLKLDQVMEWVLGIVAIVLLILGLVGQAFEMRKIRLSNLDEIAPTNIFTDKKNFKWYAMIGAALILWYAAEHA
jgi:hypothetical protein